MVEFLVLIISVVSQATLGSLVIIKNSRRLINRVYGVLSIAFILWSIATYFSLHPILLSQLAWVRLVLMFAAFLCYSVFLNFLVFPNHSPRNLRYLKVLTAYTALVILLVQTPFVFRELEYVGGIASPVVAPGIVFFMGLVIACIGGALLLLLKRFRASRGRERNQLRIVLFGVTTSFAAILFTNFVLVSFLKNNSLLNFGPALTLIFSGSMAYAILKHRLFDIRAAVARGLAYTLSLGTIGIFYGVLVFGLSGILTDSTSLTTINRVYFTAIALITALMFPIQKRFFDRITNKIFFRDIYDPQVFIDNLNDLLVSTIQVEPLLSHASQLIASTLKSSHINFVIIDKDNTARLRIVGTESEAVKSLAVSPVVAQLEGLHTKLIVTDELLEGHHQLREKLIAVDIAAAVRLVTHQQHIGYLLIGSKQSGNAYPNQDLKLMDIIADEIALAVQNALRFEEIENFNVTLQGKVDTATRQLRATNEKLKALDETKDEFISMASHQLRTPLTSVKGYVSMVLEGDAGKLSAQQKKLLDQAFISSQRMVYLIADLLNVSRLKTGKFIIESKPTNLAEVVEGELSQLTETAEAKKLKLEYDKPKEFPLLNLDETKIRQVIMNFADNAIYYTPAGGHIKVSLEDKGEAVEFTVKDDGIGVPKAEQHNLFNKFYRAGNARKARPDGTGLGLFMAKKVIVAQGGAVIFHSEEGKGSTFGFSFPKQKLLAKQPAAKQS